MPNFDMSLNQNCSIALRSSSPRKLNIRSSNPCRIKLTKLL